MMLDTKNEQKWPLTVDWSEVVKKADDHQNEAVKGHFACRARSARLSASYRPGGRATATRLSASYRSANWVQKETQFAAELNISPYTQSAGQRDRRICSFFGAAGSPLLRFAVKLLRKHVRTNPTKRTPFALEGSSYNRSGLSVRSSKWSIDTLK